MTFKNKRRTLESMKNPSPRFPFFFRVFPLLAAGFLLLVFSCEMPPAEPLLSLSAMGKRNEEVIKFWLNAGLDSFRPDATSWSYNFRGTERVNEGVHRENKNIELRTWFANACKKVNPKNGIRLLGEIYEKICGFFGSPHRGGVAKRPGHGQ
jgi:hypothetical protein